MMISIQVLEKMAHVLKLLAHPQRLKIIEILEKNREAPVYVISEGLDLPQAVTSHHLNQMKRVGLVSTQRRGKEVWYAIADRRSLTILDCIRSKKNV